MGIDNSEARQLIQDYFKTFPKVKAYMEHAKALAREKDMQKPCLDGDAIFLISNRLTEPYAVSPNATP